MQKNMTCEQFAALAQLMRLRDGPSKEAAQMVLVDQSSHHAATVKTGLSYSGVGSVVRRCESALELAKLAAG